MTEATAEVQETADPLVKVDRDKYQTAKTASGGKSLNNGDVVATALEGIFTDETYEVAGKLLTFPLTVSKVKIESLDALKGAYDHLNDGMQRMNLGNRIRGAIAQIDKANVKALETAKKGDKDGAVNEKAVDKAENAKSGEEKFLAILSPFTKARTKREAEAEKEKEAKAKEAQANKDADAKKAEAKKVADDKKAA